MDEHDKIDAPNKSEKTQLSLEAQEKITRYVRVLENEPNLAENIKGLDSFEPNLDAIFVVPAYNEDPETLAECVRSIFKSSQNSHQKIGVIIVINASEDASESSVDLNQKCEKAVTNDFRNGNTLVVKRYGKHGFPKNKAGVGPARNIGAAYACHYALIHNRDVIIQHTDTDTIIPEDFVQKLTGYYLDPKVQAIGGKAKFRYDEKGENSRAVELTKLTYIYEKAIQKYFLPPASIETAYTSNFPGCNMSSRASALAEVGGIPEIKGAEDTVFGERLKEKGLKILFPDDLIVHPKFRESDRTTTGHGLGVIKIAESVRNDPKTDVQVNPISYYLLKSLLNESVKNGGGYISTMTPDEQNAYILTHNQLSRALTAFIEETGYQGTAEEYLKERPTVNQIPLTKVAPTIWARVLEVEVDKKDAMFEALKNKVHEFIPTPEDSFMAKALTDYLETGIVEASVLEELKSNRHFTDEQIQKTIDALDLGKAYAMMTVIQEMVL